MAAKKIAQGKKKSSAVPVDQQSVFNLTRIKDFNREVKAEFYKIAWPEKKHTIATTGVVAVLVMLVSLYLGAVDLVLGKLIGFIIK